MPGGFLRVLHALFFRELPEKRVPKNVRRDGEALPVFPMSVRLIGHSLQRLEKLHP